MASRPPRLLREQARARAQARRMNEMARVVKRELEDQGGGGLYGDTSSGYEIPYEQPLRGTLGFQMPGDARR
jgi:hypothetical protein